MRRERERGRDDLSTEEKKNDGGAGKMHRGKEEEWVGHERNAEG